MEFLSRALTVMLTQDKLRLEAIFAKQKRREPLNELGQNLLRAGETVEKCFQQLHEAAHQK